MKTTKYYLIGIILGIVVGVGLIGSGGWILYNVDSESNGIFTIIGLLLLLFGLVTPVTFYLFGRDKARSHCSKCGASLVGGEYSWQLQEFENRHTQNGNFIDYKYDINCTCPKCGENKNFVAKISCKENANPQVSIRKYLNSIFKHR